MSRLQADVLGTRGDLFVPTTESYAVGAQVQVELEAPDLLGLVVSATVQQLRPLGGRTPAGLLVKLDDASLDKCRRMFATEADTVKPARTDTPVDCSLPARLISPTKATGLVKSLSMTSLTLNAAVDLKVDSVVQVAVRLSESNEVTLNAAVTWTRPDLQLSGLRISDLPAPAAVLLNRTIGGLAVGTVKSPASALAVVVADDDPAILDFLARVITREGHRVIPAERGDQALALVKEMRPAAVFLDVLMPGLDGLDVCRAIRSDTVLAKTPVVLLSAMGESRLVSALVEVGANDYLTKPMRLETVRALLSKYLSRP